VNDTETDANPLLKNGLPAFSRIRPEQALPALEQRLDEYRRAIAQVESRGDPVDYAGVVETESRADNALANTWSTVSHLHSVNSTPEWRAAYQSCLEPLTRFHTERGQNRKLWAAYNALSQRPDFAEQDAALRATIEHELADFHLSGVDLPETERRRFGEVSLRLSELGNRFGNQVLDATEAWSEHFTGAGQLAGLPASELELLAGMARAAGKPGWLADLSWPAYRAIITYADDRGLRERFYRAHSGRASDAGPNAGQFDNGPVIREMLALRHEQANLLGFKHYAGMRLTRRMATSARQVEAFLLELSERARPSAQAQLDELNRFAAGLGAPAPLEAWDIAYYSEKLRHRQLGVNQDMLRPWFELGRVLDGLFGIAAGLFGLRFRADPSIETWHPDVRYYHVIGANGTTIAGLYLDPYSRQRKSGGAWMDVCRSRMRMAGQLQRPVAFLTCNFAPPAAGRPSLLTHDDVVTLFHEFGHCLHHVLTRIDIPAVAGISGVEWDAVEMPSQLMEGWSWEPASLQRFAHHVDSGQPLPHELLSGLLADRRFHGALTLLRQIEFALVDLSLHTQPCEDPLAVMRSVHDRIAVLPMPDDNRYLMSFTHLFDGGYAAGYYSYLWAELLARDAFGLFRRNGLFSAETGRRLSREILGVGSSRPMRDSWRAFRGRQARIDPLLDAYGIAT